MSFLLYTAVGIIVVWGIFEIISLQIFGHEVNKPASSASYVLYVIWSVLTWLYVFAVLCFKPLSSFIDNFANEISDTHGSATFSTPDDAINKGHLIKHENQPKNGFASVSYTHLTLPTIYSV